MSPSPFIPAAVILASGSSTRMGRPKLLLPWNGTTVINALIQQWRRVGAQQVAVVLAAGENEVSEELDRIGFPREQRIVNASPARGMFSSVQCAAAWNGWRTEVTHLAVALGDQPHLQDVTLRSVLRCAAGDHRIWQPRYCGRGGHPVVFPRSIFAELAEAPGPTLKEFLAERAAARAFVEVDDPGLGLDMDTPADYQALLRASSANPS